MNCFRCQRPAVIFQRYSGRPLCLHHLCIDIESRAKRSIRKNQWLSRGDRIGVVEGMEQSRALGRFLGRLVEGRHDISLVSLSPPPRASPGSPSWYASLTQGAADASVTRVALPFSLEDQAAGILSAILRGRADLLFRPPAFMDGTAVMIPFQEIPGDELILYAAGPGGGDPSGVRGVSPPIREDPFPSAVRSLLHAYTRTHPSAPHALCRYREELQDRNRSD